MRRLVLLVLAALLFVDTSALIVDVFAGGRGGGVSVRGYTRKDGTYVQPHTRSAPDGNPFNNYSFPGNYNPNTGTVTPGNQDTYLENYYKKRDSLPSGGHDGSVTVPSLSGSSPGNGLLHSPSMPSGGSVRVPPLSGSSPTNGLLQSPSAPPQPGIPSSPTPSLQPRSTSNVGAPALREAPVSLDLAAPRSGGGPRSLDR